MTREEAIKMLEYLATDTTGTLAGSSSDYAEFLVRVIDSLDMAIAALREQEEYEILKNSYAQLQDIFDGTYASNMAMGEALRKRRWIPAEERLPVIEDSEPWGELVEDKGYRFLVADDDGYVFTENFWIKANRFGDPSVTHWMPLPEPPKEEV